jgi:hypothetical protein
MAQTNNQLFVYSFTFMNQSGLALIAARNEPEGFGVLKRQGKNMAQGNQYRLVEARNLGIYYCDSQPGIILETYTNAIVAYEAISKALQNLSVVASSAIAQHDTTAGWNSRHGYIPLPGEIIVYDDYKKVTEGNKTYYIQGIKVGSGNAYVQDLAFVDEVSQIALDEHARNTELHTSLTEKLFWNRKLNVNDRAEVVGESLVLNRN